MVGGSRTSTPTLLPSFVLRDPRNTEATKAGAPPPHGALWPAWTAWKKNNKKESKSNQGQWNFYFTSRQPRSASAFTIVRFFGGLLTSWLPIFLTKHTHLEKPTATMPSELKQTDKNAEILLINGFLVLRSRFSWTLNPGLCFCVARTVHTVIEHWKFCVERTRCSAVPLQATGGLWLSLHGLMVAHVLGFLSVRQ